MSQGGEQNGSIRLYTTIGPFRRIPGLLSARLTADHSHFFYATFAMGIFSFIGKTPITTLRRVIISVLTVKEDMPVIRTTHGRPFPFLLRDICDGHFLVHRQAPNNYSLASSCCLFDGERGHACDPHDSRPTIPIFVCATFAMGISSFIGK